MPIFDQGYQHWTGALSGHAWRWLAITRHGVRVATKNRILRLLTILAWLPALLLVFVLCLWGLLERKSGIIAPLMPYLTFLHPEILMDPRHYRLEVWTILYHYFLTTELQFSMIVVVLVGPSLISQDLRFNALPLYFSRPLRRIDYFLGKLGIIVVFLGRMLIVPCVIAYVLGLLFSLDWTILRDTLRLLISSVTYGMVIALSAGILILALSSLTRNSRYVALFWVGIWLVSSGVGWIMGKVEDERQEQTYRAVEARQRSMANMMATPQEQIREQQEVQRQMDKALEDVTAEQARAAKRDWRPLTSYTANLSRIGERLLGTNAAWEKLSVLVPPMGRRQFLIDVQAPQYPWKWSAGVLLGIFGLSACILNFRVKSLDRLK